MESFITAFGLTSATKRVACGASSRNSPSRFAVSATLRVMTPVALPPGRLRLATRPSAMGSEPVPKTIGIIEVAALAASAPAVLWGVAITATCRRTRSAAWHLYIGYFLAVGLGLGTGTFALSDDDHWS